MKDFIIKYYSRMRDYLLKANSEEADVEGITFEVDRLKEEYYNKTGENMASTDSEYKEQNAVWGLFRKFERLYGENSNFVERDAKSLLAMKIDLGFGIGESPSALVYSVVVGQVQVGDAVLLQGMQPFRLCAEDELFEDGCLDFRGRALEIAYHHLGGTEHGVDAF